MNKQFKGLTKGDQRALDALGIQRLGESEASKSVRIRGSSSLFERLKEMSAREIGEVLERALG